jgi:hypothetical protein
VSGHRRADWRDRDSDIAGDRDSTDVFFDEVNIV